MNGWQPMTTAPRDGTVVLVTETPNGQHFNVMPAMYANQGGARDIRAKAATAHYLFAGRRWR